MLETKVAEMLGQLSDKLGVASSKIWEWSLLQVKVEIVTNIIYAVLAVVLSVVIYRIAIKTEAYLKAKKEEDKKSKSYNPYHIDDDIEFGAMLLVVAIVAIFAFDLYALFGLFDIPKLLINPEYAAFENIVEQLGQLK